MALLTPYGDPQAHGSVANAYSFRRSRGSVVLEKKPTASTDHSPLQDQNRVFFGESIKVCQKYNANSGAIFHPASPLPARPNWARFTGKYRSNYIQFVLLRFSPQTFRFLSYEHEDGTKHFTCDNFCIVAYCGDARGWVNLGGLIAGDPVVYPYNTDKLYIYFFNIIYSINVSHKVHTTYHFEMWSGWYGTWEKIDFIFPRYKKLGSCAFYPDLAGYFFRFQGISYLYCIKF